MTENSLPQPQPTSTGEMALIGEEGPKGSLVSMQLLQGIYNEITGKSEELTKGYDVDFAITFPYLEQLHAKILQLHEQYSIQAHNESIAVYFYKDTRETFSSFERFRLFNNSSLSQVESVLIKYNFMICLPKTKKVQPYTISIRLASKITIAKKMEEDLPGAIRFLRVMGSQTARVTVQYIDYLVARNFMDAIDGWLQGLPKTNSSRCIKWLSHHSHYFPVVAKFSLGAVALICVLGTLPRFLPAQSVEPTMLAQAIVLSLTSIFALFSLGQLLGTLTEDALDEYYPLSYLSLTRGDQQQIENAQRRNKRKIAKAILGVIGTFILGVAASIVANTLTP